MWLLSNEHRHLSQYNQNATEQRETTNSMQKQMKHAVRILCDSLNYNFLGIFISFHFILDLHTTLKLANMYILYTIHK